MSTRHRLLGLTVAVLWGLNFIAIHAGLGHFPPLFFAGLRFAVMAVPVIAFVPRPRVRLRWFLLYGIGFGTIQFTFLFLAMAHGMPTGLASLVLQASAPFTVILGVALLGERLSRRQIAGIAIAVGGMGLIAADRLMHGATAALVPVLLTLVGALGWAFGNLGSRKALEGTPAGSGPSEALRLTLWMSVIPPIPMFALSMLTEGPTAGWSAVGSSFDHSGLIALAGLTYVVLLGTIAGSGLWTYLMSHYPASRVAPFSLLVPVIGLTASWAVLGERPSILEIAGAVVVIGGCFLGMGAVKDSGPCQQEQPGPEEGRKPSRPPARDSHWAPPLPPAGRPRKRAEARVR